MRFVFFVMNCVFENYSLELEFAESAQFLLKWGDFGKKYSSTMIKSKLANLLNLSRIRSMQKFFAVRCKSTIFEISASINAVQFKVII